MAHRLSPKRISSICPTLWNIGRAVLLLAFLQCPVRSQDYTISYRYFDGGQDYSSVGYWGQLVDSRGFLWIGNQTGLDRFDGHTFTSYNHRVHGLPDEVISGIAEDEEGMLWLLHRFFYFGETVMSLFDPNTEQSISLETYLSTSLPFPASDAAVIAGNRNTGIYILTRSGGLYRYYNQSFSYLGNTQRVEQNATLLPLVQGGCWVGIGQHLVRYTAEGKVVDQIDCVQDLRKFIRADENGLPWYTTLRLRDSLQVDYQLWQGRKRRSQFATQRGGPGTMSFLGMDTTQGITYLISPKHEYDTLIVTDTAGHPLSLHPHSVSFSSPHYYPLTPTFWNQTIEKGMFLVHTQQNRFLLPGQRQ
ncbi:MAG TPA: hypothetical protein DCR93_34485, partial [Cytophagales bacterium]|nr:hypothetical protein [Cytophagales bacterium]